MKFAVLTLIAAIVASIAATASAGLGWPVWAMFVGWVAFFTGGHSARSALASYLCVAAGIGFGVFAAMAVSSLLPLIDFFAFGVVVFVVAIVVVSLRAAPFLNNVAAYFLGLIAFFASHLAPGLASFLELAMAGAVGTLAAWTAHQVSGQVAKYTA